eukprot:2093951-Amphidinium_carterae.1
MKLVKNAAPEYPTRTEKHSHDTCFAETNAKLISLNGLLHFAHRLARQTSDLSLSSHHITDVNCQHSIPAVKPNALVCSMPTESIYTIHTFPNSLPQDYGSKLTSL